MKKNKSYIVFNDGVETKVTRTPRYSVTHDLKNKESKKKVICENEVQLEEIIETVEIQEEVVQEEIIETVEIQEETQEVNSNVNKFKMFKNKILLETLIKAVVIGSSIGIISFAIPYIYFKIKDAEFKIFTLILISTILSVLVMGVLFLIWRPTDKKAAKRIDKTLGLNEKVQTMIEFQNDNNFVVELQKEQTINILNKIPLKKLTMKFGVMFFILIGLAFSLCVGVVAVSIEEPDPGITDGGSGSGDKNDPIIETTDWHILAIIEIIEEVNKSTINENLKTKYKDILYDLIDKLMNNEYTEKERIELITTVIDEVKLQLDIVNSNNEIYEILRVSEVKAVQELAIQLNILNENTIYNLIENFIILANNSEQGIIEVDDQFRTLLVNSNLNKNDPLVSLLIKFGEDFRECRKADNINDALTELVENSREPIMEVIRVQAENKEIADFIEYELKVIFGLISNEDGSKPSHGEGNVEQTPPSRDPNKTNTGGLGTGEVLFGSNDAFFDPDKGSVEYGDVLTSYYGTLLGKFEEGTIPEELREIFEVYFEKMFGTDSSKEEE